MPYSSLKGHAQGDGIGEDGSISNTKVLLVANTDWYLYRFRLSLAKLLHQIGFTPTLASPPGPHVEKLKASGFRWIPISINRRGSHPYEELSTIREFIALYRAERPVLVHHFTVKPVLYGSLAARAVGDLRVVNSITGLGYLFHSNDASAKMLRGLITPAYRYAMSKDHLQLIFGNGADAEHFLQKNLARPNQCTVIEGVGVDLDSYPPLREPDGPPVVLMASRLLWDKGVGEFVEAAKLVRRHRPEVRFALVGGLDPGNPSAIEKTTIDTWVEDRTVEWWGYREDMSAVFSECIIVVLPSYGEGLPTVLLEAAASGRPIIATDIPGCREIVEHGRNGLLVPPRNSAALAEAAERLIEDGKLRRRMGILGRERMEKRFDQRQINERTLEVYDRAMVGKS